MSSLHLSQATHLTTMAGASTISKWGGKDGETGQLYSTMEQRFKENRMLMTTSKSYIVLGVSLYHRWDEHTWGKEGWIELCGNDIISYGKC